jgi:putative ABC transport system permease protein
VIRPGIRRLLRLPLSPRELAEHETEEEMRLHLELRAEQLERRGLSPEAARAEARRRFGPPCIVQRAARRREERLRLREWLDSVRQDVSYGARQLVKNPGHTAAVVATLALGLGASVAIFSAGRAIVSHAIPFPESQRLFSVDMLAEDGFGRIPSYEDFGVWKAEVASVARLAGFTHGSEMVGNGNQTIYAWSLQVTPDFFPVLRPRTLLGRPLLPGDERADAAPAAVVSPRIWRELLGSDDDAVGKPIVVGGRMYTVVGVLASGQAFPAPIDVWTPITPATEDLSSLHVSVIGRLRPGATTREAQAALRTIQLGLDAGRPADERWGPAEILPLTGRNADFHKTAAVVLVAAVAFLLLIGTANAAGLTTTRAIERRHEIAIRASLGAGRWRIARQLLTESTLLALAAGACGVAVAHLMLQALRLGMPQDLTRQILGWERLGLDATALLFAVGISLAGGFLFGLAPAITAVRRDPAGALRDGARSATTDRGGSRLARLLLAGEIALALPLLLTAGLLTRSMLELTGAEPGFEPKGVVAFEWILPRERYEGQERVERFQTPLLERLRSVPGVRSAGLISDLPATLGGPSREYRVEGTDAVAEAPRAAWRRITPGYLETLRIPLARGRQFTPADDTHAPRVAIISEALARRHWPESADPLGPRLRIQDEDWLVVGVAGDVHSFGAGSAPAPTVYVPQAQSPTRSGFLVAQVAGDPSRVGALLRREAWNIDPDVAVGEARSMERVIHDFLADQRVMAYLMAVYAAMALVITVVGLYALVAHSVARRRREFGIRLALGAGRRRIVAEAMERGLAWVGAGIAGGFLIAAGGARLLAGMLYGVKPLDPLVYGVVCGGTIVVALLASYLPSRRAARVDPAIALRAE